MITKAELKDCWDLAELHHKTITEGFLSKLGKDFLRSLYCFLINKELVLVYKNNNKILGFVSFSLNSNHLIKKFARTKPLGILQILWFTIKNPLLLFSIIETGLIPFKSKFHLNNSINKKLPVSELLSISVDNAFQKEQIGTQLLHALEEYLCSVGQKTYKVIAGESLISANRFYLKNGFLLTKKIKTHGENLSNVYIKKL